VRSASSPASSAEISGSIVLLRGRVRNKLVPVLSAIRSLNRGASAVRVEFDRFRSNVAVGLRGDRGSRGSRADSGGMGDDCICKFCVISDVRRASIRFRARLGELRWSSSGSSGSTLLPRMGGLRPGLRFDSSLLPRRSAVTAAGLLRAEAGWSGSDLVSHSAMQSSVRLLHMLSALRRTLRSTTVAPLAVDADE